MTKDSQSRTAHRAMPDTHPAELKALRKSLDNFDLAMVHILAERFKVTASIGALKAAHRLPVEDRDREVEKIASLQKAAEAHGLDREIARKFIRLVMDEATERHRAFSASNG